MIINSCYFAVAVGGGSHMCVHFPSFGFADVRLFIFCVFIGVVNFLGLEFSFYLL